MCLFVSQKCFHYPGPFVVLYVFQIFFFYFYEDCDEDFNQVFFESVNFFWLNGHFDNLILSIYKHEMSFHFLVSFSVFLFSNLKFQLYKSFTSLVRSNSICFILFEVTKFHDTILNAGWYKERLLIFFQGDYISYLLKLLFL